MPIKNHYQTLGLDNSATLDDIKKAFRQKVAQYHPDVNNSEGAESRFGEVVEAFDILSDEEKRSAYDTMLNQEMNAEPLYPEQEMVLEEWGSKSKEHSEKYGRMSLEDLLMLGFIAETGVVDGLLDSAGDIIDSAADAMDGLFDLF